MLKKTLILVVVFLPVLALAAEPNTPTVLREDVPVKSLDGQLVHDDANDVWLFETADDVKDDKAILPAGSRVPLVGCSMLEKMTTVFAEIGQSRFRIWATTIKYRNQNYFYPVYFLSLEKPKETVVEKPDTNSIVSLVEDSNTLKVLPDAILKKLEPKSIVSASQLTEALKNDADTVIISRTGFMRYDNKSQKYIFNIDSLGRSISDIKFNVHPSQTLEQVEKISRKSSEPVRFRVSGRITKFHGQTYILLHQATPAYNFGNFSR
jgi:hypothetical protein